MTVETTLQRGAPFPVGRYGPRPPGRTPATEVRDARQGSEGEEGAVTAVPILRCARIIPPAGGERRASSLLRSRAGAVGEAASAAAPGRGGRPMTYFRMCDRVRSRGRT